MGERHRHPVRRVRGLGRRLESQEARDHRRHLQLVRAAGADDRLLDRRGRILGDREPRLLGGEQDHPAGVPKHERGAHVLMIESILEGEGVGMGAGDQFGDPLVQLREPVGEGGVAGEADDAALDEPAESVPRGTVPRVHHSVAGDGGARVDAQDSQTSAIASASMSKLENTFATSSMSSSVSIRASNRLASPPSTFTVFLGMRATSAEITGIRFALSCSCTACSWPGVAVIRKTSPSRTRSSAPASRAASIVASSSALVASTVIWALQSNIHATELVAPRLPPWRPKACRISATARYGLSVVTSIRIAAPPG